MATQTNTTGATQNVAQAQTAPQTSKHELTVKSGIFTNREGKRVKYVSLYVNVNGVDVKLEPADNTGKQLIALAFGGGD